MEGKEKRLQTEGIHYLSAFETLAKNQFSREPAWLGALRKNAIESFLRLGFPSLRDEDWKYTDVRPIAETLFQPYYSTPNGRLSSEALKPYLFKADDWHLIVFINGIFSEKLSLIGKLPTGVVLSNLQKALKTQPDLIREHLGRQAQHENNSFTALNTAFFCDGFFLYVPSGTVIETPIHVVFISSTNDRKIIAQPRSLIIADSDSRVYIVESHISVSSEEHFSNTVSEMFLARGASLNLARVERENPSTFRIATSRVVQSEQTHFRSFSVSLGGKISRNSLEILLNGEGAECSLDGLYLARGNEHVDSVTFVKHEKPHGKSRQLYKGILDDASTTVFSGKVFVEKDAQKTDAEQTNKNLLLSEHATADTRPQLEIFADDVKCTHGAAVGYLDEEAVFYLRSRGINTAAAEKILTFGFAYEVIEHLELGPVREEIDKLVHERLDSSSIGGNVGGRPSWPANTNAGQDAPPT